jgi:hypothetical protein
VKERWGVVTPDAPGAESHGIKPSATAREGPRANLADDPYFFCRPLLAVAGHLCNLELIDTRTRERLERDRPTKADYLEGGMVLREELAPPAVGPRFAQAVVRGYKRHKLSARRAIELLRETVTSSDLQSEGRVPRESMRAQFDLD